MGGFVQVLSRDVRTYTLSHVDEVGELSFAEQAAWTHSQDILFAPRGAQNINFLWVRPCTVILEIFPHSYYIPGEYLQLAKAAGAITFSAYDGLHPEHDTLRTPSDFHLRVTARAASFTTFDIRAAERALAEMRGTRIKCRLWGSPPPTHPLAP